MSTIGSCVLVFSVQLVALFGKAQEDDLQRKYVTEVGSESLKTDTASSCSLCFCSWFMM